MDTGLLVELGELEEARRLLEQGRKIAREQGDIETVGWSHMFSTWLAYFQGEPEAALGHAQQALGIADLMRHGPAARCEVVGVAIATASSGRYGAARDRSFGHSSDLIL